MKKMKFVFGVLSLAVATMAGNQVKAQKGGGSNTFEVGTTTVNVGIGVGRSSYGGYGIYGSSYYGYGTGFGVKAAAERGMWQLGPGVLSLGAELGASFSSATYSGYKSSIVIAAVRSAYHYGFNVDKLDTYGGLSLGPGFRSYNYYDGSSYTKHDVTASLGAFVGGSYFLSPNIGVNVEFGYDITVLQGGVIFKLK